MSRTSKQASRRGVINHARTGPKHRSMPYTSTQVGDHSKFQTSGTMLATTFGLGLAVAVVLGLALLAIIGHGGKAASASGGGSSKGISVSYGSLNHPKGPCGNSGQAPCSPINPGWFSLNSESPDIDAGTITGSHE